MRGMLLGEKEPKLLEATPVDRLSENDRKSFCDPVFDTFRKPNSS